MAFHKPGDDEQISVSNYLTIHKPVKEHEREYAQHKEDLVTLRPGREHAWLDRSIEKTLQAMQKPLPFVHVCISQTYCSFTANLHSDCSARRTPSRKAAIFQNSMAYGTTLAAESMDVQLA